MEVGNNAEAMKDVEKEPQNLGRGRDIE